MEGEQGFLNLNSPPALADEALPGAALQGGAIRPGGACDVSGHPPALCSSEPLLCAPDKAVPPGRGLERDPEFRRKQGMRGCRRADFIESRTHHQLNQDHGGGAPELEEGKHDGLVRLILVEPQYVISCPSAQEYGKSHFRISIPGKPRQTFP